jgi:gluconokinase
MLLVQRCGWLLLESDDFRPAASIEKMKHGIALCDQDRAPWLAAIHAELLQCAAKNHNAVRACSALRKRKLG